jgi:hypothetical protein
MLDGIAATRLYDWVAAQSAWPASRYISVLPLHPLRRGSTHKGSQTCLIVLYVPPVVAQSLSYSGPALTQSLGRLSTLLISASPLIVT